MISPRTMAAVAILAVAGTGNLMASKINEIGFSAIPTMDLQIHNQRISDQMKTSSEQSWMLANILKSYVETGNVHSRPEARSLREVLSDLLGVFHRGDTAAIMRMGISRNEFVSMISLAVPAGVEEDDFAIAAYERSWRQTRNQWILSTRAAFDRLHNTRPVLFTLYRMNSDAEVVSGSNVEKFRVTAILDDPDALEARFTLSVATVDGLYRIVELGPVTTR